LIRLGHPNHIAWVRSALMYGVLRQSIAVHLFKQFMIFHTQPKARKLHRF